MFPSPKTISVYSNTDNGIVASSFGKAAGATQVIKREEQEAESIPTQSPSSPVTEPLFPPSARTSFSNPHHGSAEEVT